MFGTIIPQSFVCLKITHIETHSIKYRKVVMLYKTEIKQNHTSMLHCFLKIYAYSESYGGNML